MTDLHEHTVLGRTGLRVSRLGIGAGYDVPAEAVERAYREHGVNYLYWGSRRSRMREAIRRLAPGGRDRLVVVLQSYDHLGPFMGRFLEKGLRELGLDHADILLLGWWNAAPPPRVLAAARRLRERGLVRFIGMSGHDRRTFGELARRPDLPIDVFMVRYNAAHRGAETEIFPHLPEERRPGVVSYTATAWRRLLDPRRAPPGEAPLTATECYRFVLTNPAVDVCLCGPRSMAEMDGALAALDAGPLSPGELERARRVGDAVHGRPRGR